MAKHIPDCDFYATVDLYIFRRQIISTTMHISNVCFQKNTLLIVRLINSNSAKVFYYSYALAIAACVLGKEKKTTLKLNKLKMSWIGKRLCQHVVLLLNPHQYSVG